MFKKTSIVLVIIATVMIMCISGVCLATSDIPEEIENLLEDPNQITEFPLTTMGDMAYYNGKYPESYHFYYGAYLTGEIDRQVAKGKIQKTKKELSEEQIVYYGISKLSKMPNIHVSYFGSVKGHDFYLVVINNQTDLKMTLNGVATKGVAITLEGKQVESYTVFDLPDSLMPFYNELLSDNKIYPHAIDNFAYIFPGHEIYRGLYIDSIYYSDNTSEEIYIDFFND